MCLPPDKRKIEEFFSSIVRHWTKEKKNPLIFGIPPQGENNGWEGKLFSPAEIEVGFLKIRLMVLFSPPTANKAGLLQDKVIETTPDEILRTLMK